MKANSKILRAFNNQKVLDQDITRKEKMEK